MKDYNAKADALIGELMQSCIVYGAQGQRTVDLRREQKRVAAARVALQRYVRALRARERYLTAREPVVYVDDADDPRTHLENPHAS